MPNMANITVKNKANADVVYSAATPSSGDKNPAVWRQNTPASIAFRPIFQFSTRNNANLSGRVFEASFNGPVVQSAGGVDTVVARVPLRASGTLPTNVPVDNVSDYYVQFSNLLVAALIRSAVEEGYAPT